MQPLSPRTSPSLTLVQTLVLGKGDFIEATTDSDKGLRFLVIAGRPIGEPIVQHG